MEVNKRLTEYTACLALATCSCFSQPQHSSAVCVNQIAASPPGAAFAIHFNAAPKYSQQFVYTSVSGGITRLLRDFKTLQIWCLCHKMLHLIVERCTFNDFISHTTDTTHTRHNTAFIFQSLSLFCKQGLIHSIHWIEWCVVAEVVWRRLKDEHDNRINECTVKSCTSRNHVLWTSTAEY